MFFLGYDVGGTKIEAALFAINYSKPSMQSFSFQNNKGEIKSISQLSRKRVPTERQLGYNSIIEKLTKLCLDILSEFNLNPNELIGIGLGMPGSIDPKTQLMHNGNTMVLINKPVAEDLQKALNTQIPVYCENDANCFALAEVRCGAGINYFKSYGIPVHSQIGIGIILGTGCGGGIVVEEKILRGGRGGGGEIGHSILYAGGLPCYCGRNGCAEQYLAGSAIESSFNARKYSQITVKGKAEEIFGLAKDSEPLAVATIKQYKKDLGFFLGNLTSMFDPHYFVLGGGVSLQPAIYEDLSAIIAQNTFLPNSNIPVFKHELGDSAGVIGAALLCV